MFSFTSALLLASACGSALASPAPLPTDIVGKLRDAPTAVDRINLLPDDSQFIFDFFNPAAKAAAGKGGKIVTANAATFPAVVGNGGAMAVGFLDACSMNTPHTHPRATEIQFSVNGTIRTGMITENGARFIMTEIPAGSMTIFPMGSVHFQINEGCEPAMFVAGFNSEDPGVLQIAQRFLGLSPDIVAATLGDIGVEEVMGLDAIIPDSIALGTDECLKRCGITRTSQPTLQRQPRVSGNAFPTGVTASAWPTHSATYTTKH
ncbi:RmlC-like cupin domain-containing protein [Mycena belliarum]|uniref:RmlC-like cupin domain-containing protein n=1 Tax=Mycena belliarum TaxID=1033014 RepID=A0AAD6TZL0_9AGAR|nr:RmlC-like cupin domain-containing protein [Mycena belliae]